MGLTLELELLDAFKDILSAYSQRIKVPIIGSIILAFIAVNWQSIFYVIFSGKSAIKRFEYWDTYTDWLSVMAWPILIGVTFAILSPFISLVGARLAEWPTEQLRLQAVRSAHNVEKEKKRLADLLIDQVIETTVEQQEKVQSIDNAGTREVVRKRIDDVHLGEREREIESLSARIFDLESLPSEAQPMLLGSNSAFSMAAHGTKREQEIKRLREKRAALRRG